MDINYRNNFSNISLLNNSYGASIVIVGITIFVLIGFAALAIDIGHIYVVRNELQNAADAAALAGARVLYSDDGTMINSGANLTAFNTARANRSEKELVDVHWPEGDDVQRGHWCFSCIDPETGRKGVFTPNDSLEPFDLWDVPTDELDTEIEFINAVRVTTRREDTPAASILAGIFGYEDFTVRATAVAYIGFAGTLKPGETDQPVAICKEALKRGDEYTCSIGRMITSAKNVESGETGAWTDYNQEGNVCQGGTNNPSVKTYICSDGNPGPINLGYPVATNNGMIQDAFSALRNCWNNSADTDSDGIADQFWNLTLPVVICQEDEYIQETCARIAGTVNLNILWISVAGTDPQYKDIPLKMEGWMEDIHYNWVADDPVEPNRCIIRCGADYKETQTGRQCCWNNFVEYFNIKNVDGTPSPYHNKSIYFLPDCDPHIPKGRTGGENFGVLARIPVLVN